MNWSVCKDKYMCFVIGFFIEDYCNKVEIVQFDDEICDFKVDLKFFFEYIYFIIKIMFIFDKEC